MIQPYLPRLATALAAALLSAAIVAPVHAQTATVNKCLGAKLSATGKSVSARALCFGKEAKTGIADPDCIQKAIDRFTGGGEPAKGTFEKLEAKFPSTAEAPCVTFDDQATFAADIADYASTLAAAIGTATGRCDAAKLKCVGKYVASVATCRKKQEGIGADLACAEEAAARLADGSRGCLDKAAAQGDCSHAGSQAAELTAGADEFIRDAFCALDPAYEGCACVPDSEIPCSTGEPGLCDAGVRTCDINGTGYGACATVVSPAPEVCGDGLDDDCDGASDDGCACASSPAAPSHGAYPDCTAAALGNTCDLACDAGYTQAGADPVCGGTGVGTSDWQGSASCGPNPCDSAPPAPVGGTYAPACTSNIPSGTTCTLSCDDGYSRTGTDPQCFLGSYTNSAMNDCLPATCPALTVPLNGVTMCEPATTGSTCTPSCGPGHNLVGGSSLECTGTGAGTSEWAGAASCEPNSCPLAPPAPVGGSFAPSCTTNVPSGTTCTLLCADGYSKTGTDPQCYLGMYSGGPSDCAPATCAALTVPATGHTECAAATTGGMCTPSCGPGHTLVGGSTLACTGTGAGTSAWTGSATCVPDSCPTAPSAPVGGTYAPTCTTNIPSGTTCPLSCANGYTKTGADPYCYLGSIANSFLNDCVPATCPAFTNPANGFTMCATSPTGTTCTPTCGPGYTRTGSTFSCTGTGVGTSAWVGTGSCVANPCTYAPTAPPHGSYPDCAAGATSGTTCTLVCDEGYTPVGDNAYCFIGAYTSTATCEPNP